MPFIPNHLQELKRKAESALGRIMLTDDTKAISAYWGALETEILPKPIDAMLLVQGIPEPTPIKFYGVSVKNSVHKVYFETPLTLTNGDYINITWHGGSVYGAVYEDVTDGTYHAVQFSLRGADIWLDFANPRATT